MNTRREPEETEFGPVHEMLAAARRAVADRSPGLRDADDSQAIPAFGPAVNINCKSCGELFDAAGEIREWRGGGLRKTGCCSSFCVAELNHAAFERYQDDRYQQRK